MITQQHLDQFEDQGFTIVRGVAGPEMRARLIDAVEEALQKDRERYGGLPGKEDFIALDLVQYGGAFWDYLESDTVHEAFSSVLDEFWIAYSFTSSVPVAISLSLAAMDPRPGEKQDARHCGDGGESRVMAENSDFSTDSPGSPSGHFSPGPVEKRPFRGMR